MDDERGDQPGGLAVDEKPPGDTAPRRRGRPPGSRNRDRKPGGVTRVALTRKLTDLFVSLGAMVSPFDPTCGPAVVERAPDIAKALNKLANENDSVRKSLERMLTASAWGEVIAACAPILLIVAAHHTPIVPKSIIPVFEGGGEVDETSMIGLADALRTEFEGQIDSED